MTSECSAAHIPGEQPGTRPTLWQRCKRFVRFALVGGSGVAVNLGVFHLCYVPLQELLPQGPAHTVSNLAGVFVSILTNFLLNDSWTWGDRAKGNWWPRLARYYVVCGVAAMVQVLVAKGVFDLWLRDLPFVLAGINLSPHAAVLTGIVAGILINFPVSHFWAFRDVKKP